MRGVFPEEVVFKLKLRRLYWVQCSQGVGEERDHEDGGGDAFSDDGEIGCCQIIVITLLCFSLQSVLCTTTIMIFLRCALDQCYSPASHGVLDKTQRPY